MTSALQKITTKNQSVISFIATLLVIFVSTSTVFSQNKVTSALIKPDSTDARYSFNDSLGIRGSKIKLISDEHAKSGSFAMLLSALLPGAGQVYVHRYYTIPFIYGFGI